MANDPLLFVLGFMYISGAFQTWWILDGSVHSRSMIVASWPLSMPILILGQQLASSDEDDDNGDDPNDYGV
jgi:hypothetical protein